MKSPSCVRLFATPWTVAHQAPPSMEFSRREYWSGLPFPSPGDLPDSGIEPWPLLSRADALPSEPPGNNQVTQLLLSDKINSVSGSWTRVFCAFLRPLCLLCHLLFCDIYLLLGLRFQTSSDLQHVVHVRASCFSRVWLFATPCSPPGSSVHGILQARVLEWVAPLFSKGSSQPRDRTCVSVSCIARQVLYR